MIRFDTTTNRGLDMIIPSEYRQAAAQRNRAMATRNGTGDTVRVYLWVATLVVVAMIAAAVAGARG